MTKYNIKHSPVLRDAYILNALEQHSLNGDAYVLFDEGSMMTLEMLAGLLSRMEKTCHLVLVGDPYQLLSVGSGNVIHNLIDLGIPYILLETNHRQVDGSPALRHNVTEF